MPALRYDVCKNYFSQCFANCLGATITYRHSWNSEECCLFCLINMLLTIRYAAPILVNIEYTQGSHGQKTRQEKVHQILIWCVNDVD